MKTKHEEMIYRGDFEGGRCRKERDDWGEGVFQKLIQKNLTDNCRLVGEQNKAVFSWGKFEVGN